MRTPNRITNLGGFLEEDKIIEDTWNLDYAFIKWVTPRLKKFIELTDGIPGEFADKEEEWEKILQDMLFGFEKSYTLIKSDDMLDFNDSDLKKSLELFTKYLGWLWW